MMPTEQRQEVESEYVGESKVEEAEEEEGLSRWRSRSCVEKKWQRREERGWEGAKVEKEDERGQRRRGRADEKEDEAVVGGGCADA